MNLDSYPEEIERLRRHQKFYEWITYLILIFTYALTFAPLGLPIHRMGINLLFLIVGIFTVMNYRVFPFEKKDGLIRYSVKQRFLSIQISDHIFGSLAIFFTGGILSPFWYLYILALIAGALALPAAALVIAGISSITLYLLTVAFFTPLFSGFYEVGLTWQMAIVPVVSIFSMVLTYVVAQDLNIEILSIRNLANDLKEKSKELLGEKNKLDSIVASIVDGVFVLNGSGNLVYINKAAESMLKINRADSLGKSFESLFRNKLFFQDSSVKLEQIHSNTNLSEDKILFGPTTLKVKSRTGSETWINFVSAGIEKGKESDIGSVCTFHDITKEIELENMKIDFVAMAAHELRTPLTAIRGYLSVLHDEIGNKLEKDEKAMIEKAFVSSTNLAALIENLLSISKIEFKSLKLNLKPANWKQFLVSNLDIFKETISQKNIKLKVDVSPTLPPVSIDKFRMSEVINNLVSNAITYTPEGGKIEIKSFVKKGELITEIKDTGEGIPESAIPHLFTKFFRVSGALEQGSKGTGLGLYISKSIIDMHKGKIGVTSQIDKGSTFVFSLPIAT